MTWVQRLTSSALGFCDCLLLVGFLGVFSLISMGSITFSKREPYKTVIVSKDISITQTLSFPSVKLTEDQNDFSFSLCLS